MSRWSPPDDDEGTPTEAEVRGDAVQRYIAIVRSMHPDPVLAERLRRMEAELIQGPAAVHAAARGVVGATTGGINE